MKQYLHEAADSFAKGQGQLTPAQLPVAPFDIQNQIDCPTKLVVGVAK